MAVKKKTDLLGDLGTFRRGAKRDNRVAVAQHLLARFGHFVKTDGLLGETTERAIAEFQEEEVIPVTGELDAKTWEALLLHKP